MENKKSNEAAIKNLETQLGQLAKQLADQNVGSSFSANTQSNPKEHCKAIITRTGRVVGNGCGKEVEIEEIFKEKEFEEEIVVENNHEKELVEKEKSRRNKKEKVTTLPIQNFPYPHAHSKKDNARHYARFMDIFKKLQINISFSEAMEKIPKHAMFMKDILTKKNKINGSRSYHG